MAKIKPKALLAQSKVKKAPSQISVTTIVTYMILGVLVVYCLCCLQILDRQRTSGGSGRPGELIPNYVTDFVVVSSSWIILVLAL